MLNIFVFLFWRGIMKSMGILKSIKNMFSKNIDCSEVLENTPFHFFSQKNRDVYVGANIIVKDGFEAVFVCHDHITDVLPAGKHTIIATNLPKTFKILKLLTAKNGTFASKFKADIYFISKGKIDNMKYVSPEAYKSRSKRFGRIKAFAEGTFDLQVEDSKKLMAFLLLERPYVLDNDFLLLIGNEVGEKVTKMLIESGKGFVELLIDNHEVYNCLNDKGFEIPYLGCSITNVKLLSMHVPEKLEKLVAEEIGKRRKVVGDINEMYGSNMDNVMPLITNKTVNDNMKVEQTSTINNENDGLKTCISCGAKINKDDNFCPKCGMRQNLF